MKYKFINFIPEIIENNTLYISIEFSTAVHNCVCGCGNEVVTPLSPTDWSITYNGKSISMDPSIGNWSFECRSHYWIEKGEIIHCRTWDEDEIKEGRDIDGVKKSKYFRRNKLKG